MQQFDYLALTGAPTGALTRGLASERTELVRSALPGAPVVPFAARPQAVPRTRAAIAARLYRLGDAIAPARSQRESATA
jgi:predicted component of type VI protein secretion system